MTRPGEKGEAVRRLGFLSIPIVVAVAAHLEFSWMGYTPTDDGWVLAGSRRILAGQIPHRDLDRKSTRLNSSHQIISYAVFCLKKKNPTPPKQVSLNIS